MMRSETVQSGGIFGELALIDDATQSADAVTQAETKQAVLDKKRFAFLVQNHLFSPCMCSSFSPTDAMPSRPV